MILVIKNVYDLIPVPARVPGPAPAIVVLPAAYNNILFLYKSSKDGDKILQNYLFKVTVNRFF